MDQAGGSSCENNYTGTGTCDFGGFHIGVMEDCGFMGCCAGPHPPDLSLGCKINLEAVSSPELRIHAHERNAQTHACAHKQQINITV